MNTYTIQLTSSGSDHTEILDTVFLDDVTNVSIDLVGIDEETPPINSIIDWGDGERTEINATVVDDNNNVIPSIETGKFSVFAREQFSHIFYPHPTADELNLEIQVLISFINGDRNYFRIPVNITTGGFMDTIEDYKVLNIYEGTSYTNYKLLTKTGYVLDMRK